MTHKKEKEDSEYKMYMIKIYLSGPMNGKTKEEATGWRNRFKKILEKKIDDNKSVSFVEHFDPCDRWYESLEEIDRDSKTIVAIDKLEYRNADVLVVNCLEKGWGTPMEMFDAYEHYDKIVLSLVKEGEFPSIWVKEHSTQLFTRLEDIADWIVKYGHKFNN
jgi:hypothetical protein